MTNTVVLKGWELALALLGAEQPSLIDLAGEYVAECDPGGSIHCWAGAEYRRLTGRAAMAKRTQRRKEQSHDKH